MDCRCRRGDRDHAVDVERRHHDKAQSIARGICRRPKTGRRPRARSFRRPSCRRSIRWSSRWSNMAAARPTCLTCAPRSLRRRPPYGAHCWTPRRRRPSSWRQRNAFSQTFKKMLVRRATYFGALILKYSRLFTILSVLCVFWARRCISLYQSFDHSTAAELEPEHARLRIWTHSANFNFGKRRNSGYGQGRGLFRQVARAA